MAMERSLRLIDDALGAIGADVASPCGPDGAGIEVKLGVDERVEIVATVLLALATVAAAWSGYQASRWNGERAKAFSRASAARIESTKAADFANAQTQVDVATFTQWVNACALKQTELADFYFARFRAEFKPAVNAWVATRPLRNEDAPLAPFAMPEYRLEARVRRIGSRRRRSSWAARRGRMSSARPTTCSASCSSRACCFAGIRQAADGGAPEGAPRLRHRRLPRNGGVARDVPGQPLGLNHPSDQGRNPDAPPSSWLGKCQQEEEQHVVPQKAPLVPPDGAQARTRIRALAGRVSVAAATSTGHQRLEPLR